MNSGPDAARVQVLPQRIPVFHPNYKKMEIVFSAGRDFRKLDAWAPEPCRICRRVLNAARVPLAKVAKFHRKHSRLECIKPRVRPDNEMNVFCRTAVVSQQSQPLRMPSIIAGDNACISIRTEVLRGIKAEAREPARSAYGDAIPFCPVGLGSIFDDCEPVLIGQFLQRRHAHCTAI